MKNNHEKLRCLTKDKQKEIMVYAAINYINHLSIVFSNMYNVSLYRDNLSYSKNYINADKTFQILDNNNIINGVFIIIENRNTNNTSHEIFDMTNKDHINFSLYSLNYTNIVMKFYEKTTKIMSIDQLNTDIRKYDDSNNSLIIFNTNSLNIYKRIFSYKSINTYIYVNMSLCEYYETQTIIENRINESLLNLGKKQESTKQSLYIAAGISFIASCIIIIILSNSIFSKTISILEKEKEIQSQDLINSELKYRTIVEQCSENIYLCSKDSYQIIEANSSLRNLLGYKEDEIKNMTIFDFIDHSRSDINHQINKIEKKGKIKLQERKYLTKSGKSVDVEVNASSLFFPNEEILCVVSRDITERKKNQDLLIKEKQKSEFYLDLFIHDIANINHSMINTIELYYMMKDKKEIFNADNTISMLKDLITRISNLSKDVLILSKADLKSFALEKLNINDIIKDEMNLALNTHPNEKINFIYYESHPTIYSKIETEFKYVIRNLLNNAIKFQIENEKIVEISIKKTTSNTIKISIADHGIGVNDKDKESIFKRYEYSKEHKYRGVGLVVVKNLVQRYGGKIIVEDRINGDSTKGLKITVQLRELI